MDAGGGNAGDEGLLGFGGEAPGGRLPGTTVLCKEANEDVREAWMDGGGSYDKSSADDWSGSTMEFGLSGWRPLGGGRKLDCCCWYTACAACMGVPGVPGGVVSS